MITFFVNVPLRACLMHIERIALLMVIFPVAKCTTNFFRTSFGLILSLKIFVVNWSFFGHLRFFAVLR